jgi:spermidine synthase
VKPKFLDKIWSYFVEVKIETASSDINPILNLVLRNGRYQLNTTNAIYSYADLYDNFTKSFEILKLENYKIEEVLILGFGLGSIPYMLEKKFKRKYYYTGVEIDPTVLVLANKYVLDDLKSGFEMICNDAYNFVQTCEQEFDLICMDVFLDDTVPEYFETVEYLNELKRLLSKNGILMYNKIAYKESDKIQSMKFFNNIFRIVFPKGRILDVNGNYMLVNE